jgi:flagellar assembly protein FliH
MLCTISNRSEEVDPLEWRPASGSSIPPAGRQPAGVAQARIDQDDRNRGAELAQARQAGFQDGIRQAREEAARELQGCAERIGQALAELATLKRRMRNEAEAEVVKLALAIARRILRREVLADPDAIQGIVHAALHKLQHRQIHRVRVFSAGAETVRACLERSGAPSAIQVIADPALRTGDILFETVAGELDASVETQLAEIDRGFADRLALR